MKTNTKRILIVTGFITVLFSIIILPNIRFITFDGDSTIVSTMYPTSGSTHLTTSSITVGAKTTIHQGDVSAYLRDFKIEFWEEGGTATTLHTKTWAYPGYMDNWMYTDTKTLLAGTYYVKMTITLYGEAVGAKQLTTKFYVTEQKGSVSINSPTSGQVLAGTTANQWDYVSMPFEIKVTAGSYAITSISAYIEGHLDRKWTGTGAGTHTFSIDVQAKAYTSGVRTDYTLRVGATDAGGLQYSTSVSFKIEWTYTGTPVDGETPADEGEIYEPSEVPGLSMLVTLVSLMVFFVLRKKKQEKNVK